MVMPGRGWFNTDNRPGDRSLEQQMLGLDPLLLEVKDKTVLDVGCAEGLISIELAKHGASWVDGIEIVQAHVDVSWSLISSYPVHITQADANVYLPTQTYDIVIALALLHKLRDPSEACARFARHARSLVVLRLPPEHAPTIIDARSNNEPHDIAKVMNEVGFALELVTRGSFNEWCGYWRRVL